MGSKRNEGNYDEAEYSDDFEPYEDDAELDDDSCDEIRVYKSSKGPTLTIQPRGKKPCTPYGRESAGQSSNRFLAQRRSSMMNKIKGSQPRAPPRPSNVAEKSRKAMMVVSPPPEEVFEEDMNETSIDGNSEPSARIQNDHAIEMYQSQKCQNRKPLRDSQVKKLAKAHVTESFQSLTVRIGGFRKTVGSNVSTNMSRSSNNFGKMLKPYTPMRCGFAKPQGTVSQRLLSAKRMTINDLKNKIKELQIEMGDLRKENSALKHVEHRHKMALRKWEGREAELPRLMEQHKEELKNAQIHVKKLSQQCRDLEVKLKQRDKKMISMEQELLKLRHLCSEAELEERQNLQTELDIVSANLCGAEKRLIQNKRHMEILEKNHQHQIHVEKQKLITANNHAMELQYEIMNLKQALRDKDRVLNYVQMKGCGRKLIRSFHEDERKTSNTSKYSIKQQKSDTNGNTLYDPSSFSNLGSWK